MGSAVIFYTTLSINGEQWSAYQTDAKRPERKWSFQCHGKSAIAGVIAFYASSLDAGVIRIHEGN